MMSILILFFLIIFMNDRLLTCRMSGSCQLGIDLIGGGFLEGMLLLILKKCTALDGREEVRMVVGRLRVWIVVDLRSVFKFAGFFVFFMPFCPGGFLLVFIWGLDNQARF